MTDAPRIRPITATEVARKLMDRPSAAESLSVKINAKGDPQPEVTVVRQGDESLMDAAKRLDDAMLYLCARILEGAYDTGIVAPEPAPRTTIIQRPKTS